MKTPLILFLLTLAAVPTLADTVTCKNGKVYRGVIIGEEEGSVTINLYGAKLTIPRNEIISFEKESPDANSVLQKQWEQMAEIYQKEDLEAERDPPPTPPPTEPPPPPDEDDTDDDSPQPIVFGASAPRAAPQSAPPTRVQQRLDWLRDSREAIYQRRVLPGMTQKQVRAAWGWPDLTHPVHGVEVYTDRWIYDRPGQGRATVYFKEGLVVSVDE